MSISAIVPVWNGRDLLGRLLDTLEAQTLPAGELLVVDNGSSDGAPELARSRGARVIAMGRNAGFAAAVNRGIREARGEWIAVLNSDVELSPGYLDALRQTAGWFATGKILSAGSSDRIDGTFDLVCRGGTAWRAGGGCPDGPLWSEPRAIWSAPWTAAIFRAELFRKIGLLEESFESYLEDVDFGMRCASAGLSGEYVPGAIAWHRGSAALGRWHPDTVRRMARNQVYLLARHYSRRHLWRCAWPILIAQLLWGGVAARHGGTIAWVHGKLQGMAGFLEARRGCNSFDALLLDHLLENEKTIGRLQAATFRESYWRLYFLLNGGEAK
jgi:GT2 family glycosyltransferase